MSRWERVLDGDGQVALIMGKRASESRGWCSASTSRSRARRICGLKQAPKRFIKALLSIRSTRCCGRHLFAGGSGSSDAIAQLAGALSHAGLDPAAAVPLLAPLFNLELPSEYPPSPLPPEQQRRRLLDNACRVGARFHSICSRW